MNADLRARRERTWELLVIEGLDPDEAVDQLAAAYGVTPATIRQDITRMDAWLPALATRPATDESRILELRQTRQRLYQMAREAQAADDLRLELDIYREVIRTLTLDEELHTSLPEGEEEVQTLLEILSGTNLIDS